MGESPSIVGHDDRAEQAPPSTRRRLVVDVRLYSIRHRCGEGIELVVGEPERYLAVADAIPMKVWRSAVEVAREIGQERSDERCEIAEVVVGCRRRELVMAERDSCAHHAVGAFDATSDGDDSNAKRMPINVMGEIATRLDAVGVSSLRYDKRGVGGSEGDYQSTGFHDNVDDARAALAAPRSRRPDDSSTDDVIRIQFVKLNAKWFREFMSFEPVDAIRRAAVAVLAITGSKDIQVNPADLELMEHAVSVPFTSHLVEDVTHLLRADSGPPGVRTYKKQTRRPLDRRVVEQLTSWVTTQTRTTNGAGNGSQ